MASPAVQAAVDARVAQNWSVCPIFSPNTAGTPPSDGSRFLQVQYPLAAPEEQITIGAPGANRWRETGAIRFLYHFRRGGGIADALPALETLRAAFRGKQFAGVNTFGPSPAAIDDRATSGNYWTLSFAVEYHFDLIG